MRNLLLALIVTALNGFATAKETSDTVSDYNIVWDSPSKDCSGSMPLGNGDIALNVWVEPNGDLAFYIGKTDSWGDNGRLLKVGKIRVKLDPMPPTEPFRQELSLIDATVKVRYGNGTELRIWVDANRPVIRMRTKSSEPVAAVAAIEIWRTEPYRLPSLECSDVWNSHPNPPPTVVEPDTVLTGLADRIGWYHYNQKSVGPAIHAEVQGVTGYEREDPLLHRIFGAVVTASQVKRIDDTHLRSADGGFDIYVLTQHPSAPDKWLEGIDKLIREGKDSDPAAHGKWWSDFWNRSWIRATANQSGSPLPANRHPLRVGEDQSGQNKFRGELRNVKTPDDLTKACSFEAEVKPAEKETGRIFDNITPGGQDGFLLDTHPGNALRLIIGSEQYSVQNALPPGAWAKVVLTVDEKGSRVSVNGRQVISAPSAGDDAAYVSRMYALQRFITACAGRGRYPIKFNGSIFNVAHPGAPGDADYRRWGPGYWWQNTRLPYLSMCAGGDFEMLDPLWRLYVDDFLPLNKYRTKHYFGIENAAYYIECVLFWGDVFNHTYGWQPMSERKDPLQVSGYHKWEWVAGPELVWMMLDSYEHTLDEGLLRDRIIPTAEAVMRFFEGYYKTNAEGKLVMHPSQALETWWDCTNPMPELAGLRAITGRLLALPENVTTRDSRAYWEEFLAKLHPLPTRDTPGGKAYAPAERFEAKRNSENPELYVVFPFRLCSFEKDNRELGVNALKHRWDRGDFGWRQDDLFMAYLGMPEEARKNVVARARNHDRNSRFPAFWGPNYDWVPDQDHGGVLMKAFQAMLMQTDGKSIFLLPAWPKDWDCDFKLHAPYKTVVEGRVENGKVIDLKVTPEERRKDVEIVQSGIS